MSEAEVAAALGGHMPRLYAVVDAARDPEVLAWVERSGLAYQCLFQGEKAKSLREEAPWLLSFGRDKAALEDLVDKFHDRAMVAYVVSSEPFFAVRRHLRRIQRVQTEDGRVLYFRYYDPRVARVFLPTLDDKQLRWMFGKVVERWLFEAPERGGLMDFRVVGEDGAAPSVLPETIVA
ncbi:MAG: DUF4123 domain-containing protein [Polyangiaceae bacterium]